MGKIIEMPFITAFITALLFSLPILFPGKFGFIITDKYIYIFFTLLILFFILSILFGVLYLIQKNNFFITIFIFSITFLSVLIAVFIITMTASILVLSDF